MKARDGLHSPHAGEYRASPRVTLFCYPIPTKRTTKILGVTFDRGMTFGHQVAEVNAKGRSRLNVIRAMSSTTFGHSKEQQTALYKQFVRQVLEYASPSWTPDGSLQEGGGGRGIQQQQWPSFHPWSGGHLPPAIINNNGPW